MKASIAVRLASLVPLLGGLAAPLPVLAWPDKAIEVIVPWTPGVEADVVGRALANGMSKRLGVPVQVINKPGAGGVPGTAEFIRAKPDGYTLGYLTIGNVVTQPLAGNAPYKPTDMEPIALVADSAFLLVSRSDGPIKSVGDLETSAKKKPVIVANFGPAAVPTLTVQRMGKAKAWNFKPVTFASAGWPQLASGDAEIVTAMYNTVEGQIRSGQAKGLVVFAKSRLPALPDVPTLREAGYGFDGQVWSGFFAPKGTPPAVIEKVDKAISEALNDPEVKEFGKRINIVLYYKGAKEAAEQIQQDMAALRPAMEEIGAIKR